MIYTTIIFNCMILTFRWNEPSPVDKEAQPRGSRTSGNDLLSQVKKKMAENHTVTLERRSQYEFLGAHHDSTKLIHVPDISLLKSAPKDISKARDFLWNDINFTKDSTFPKKQFKLKGVSYNLKRARCNGVKVRFFSIIYTFYQFYYYCLIVWLYRYVISRVKLKNRVRMQYAIGRM